MAERSLIAEIEGIFESGSSDRQAEILRRVTDLFLAGASQYSEEQVDLFDGVIIQLAERIETKARAELADRIAPIENAPRATVRALAHDDAIEVAGPILTQSSRLTDDDLLAVAEKNNQDRLMAISKRSTISERVGDALVARGDREVVLSVTKNEGARFSDAGYSRLVAKSIDDEVLAICVGLRQDIPRQHFQTLIEKASQVVLEKLAADHPSKAVEVQRVLTGITGMPVHPKPRDEMAIAAEFDAARKAGQSPDAMVYELALAGRFTETVIALSALAHTPRALVESIMSDRRADNDFTLLLAKAANLSWPSAMQICILRRGPGGLPPLALEAAQRNFEKLQVDTARRVVGFYNQRRAALSDFENLEQNMGAVAQAH